MSDVEGGSPSYTRVCRRCSAQSTTTGDTCPACGTAFVRSRRPSRRLVLGVVAVLVVAGAGAGAVLVKAQRDADERDRVAVAEAQAAQEAADREAAAQEEADDLERDLRAETVDQLEKNITKHARKLVRQDLLEGPIKYSSCTAVGGSTDDLTALTGTFECIAVNKENKDDTVSGYSYAGTADWSSGEISWKLGS